MFQELDCFINVDLDFVILIVCIEVVDMEKGCDENECCKDLMYS